MILSDDDIIERINNPKNLAREVVVITKPSRPGRPEGSENLSMPMRELVGGLARSGIGQEDLEKEFGISQTVISQSSRGMIGSRLDADLAKSVRSKSEDRLDIAHEAALDVLMESLKALKPKMRDPEIKPQILSKIAADMSKVSGNMRGNSRDGMSGNSVQVVIIAPPQKKESDYESILA